MSDSRPPLPNAAQRRSAVRTAVVWEALRALLHDRAGDEPLQVLDIGGGTGGFAVGVAELGHRVTVVDPSPDALATLARRSEESGVADRVAGVQGDLTSVTDQVEAGTVDVVLCHGVLEVVEDPDAAMAAIARVLHPGGALSLLVRQRHAAVVARAMAGSFTEAEELLAGTHTGPAEESHPRRYTADEVTTLLDAAGFTNLTLHAVRVFSDLVPSATVDLEPGAADALADLERAVAERPEYLTLATQIHALGRR